MSNDMNFVTMPLVAIRGLVIFPGMQLHFDVSRKQSISALKTAMSGDREVFFVCQKDILNDNPDKKSDFYPMGSIGTVKQMLSMPNTDIVRVAVEGSRRAHLNELVSVKPHLVGLLRTKKTFKVKQDDADYGEALVRVCKADFQEYAGFIPKIPTDLVLSVLAEDRPGELADFIAGNIILEPEQKQLVLNELHPLRRIEKLCAILRRETELLELEEGIQERVSDQMEQNQREYYLREQMKAISLELDGEEANEAEQLREKAAALQAPDEVHQKLETEIKRYEKSSKSSPEAAVIRTWIDTCLALPWGKATADKLDLKKARKVLDNDHYGMTKIKDRIIELLAVRKLAPDITGQIICLVGPPGVGKTSIARSVANAMGRKYARISLGGIKDEAEIRGHRKTYIGSMPGRIINAVQLAGSSNPLILLDEVDKIGADYKGDPSSALLEALDAEQNFAFRDHYLEVPFDLSKVLFITTANDKSTIPEPLLDRMEIIELGSYTAEEKFNIAKGHLVPKQAKVHGLNGKTLRITDDAIRAIIGGYVREAGVRKLERELAAICRKAAVMVANGEKCVRVGVAQLEGMLGTVKYKADDISHSSVVGVANGLAWTAVGGELLEVEALVLEGTGKLELTGSLGDVMKESAAAAVSCIRSRADKLSLDKDFYKTKDIHLHFPEGAVPKDGPSAGITIVTALVSALSGLPVRGDVAMTGEVTLRGRVLPIGGLKEKTMAAYTAGMKTVIIPQKNRPDIDELDDKIKNGLEFVCADSVDTVLDIALVKKSAVLDETPVILPVIKEASNSVNAIVQ